MNIVFNGGMNCKSWELKGDRVTIGGYTAMLKDVIAITHGAPASKWLLGIFYFWVREGTGNIACFSVKYTFANAENAKNADAYMRQHSGDVFTRLGIMGKSVDSEIHVRCNACGEVYTFTVQDINEQLNKIAAAAQQEQSAKANAFGAMGNALFGTRANANLHNMQADMNRQNAMNAKQSFIDYSKCICCHASDIEVLSDAQWSEHLQQVKNQRNVAPAAPASSAMDELKKLKELLDMGIVTQEEFDAKKKQLLGL